MSEQIQYVERHLTREWLNAINAACALPASSERTALIQTLVDIGRQIAHPPVLMVPGNNP